MRHDFCPVVNFCRQCGAAESLVVDGRVSAECQPNEVGRKRWEKALAKSDNLVAAVFALMERGQCAMPKE